MLEKVPPEVGLVGMRKEHPHRHTTTPPYTADVFFVQFLWSQRNMEQMQRNLEEALRNITDNTCRGDNQGGR